VHSDGSLEEVNVLRLGRQAHSEESLEEANVLRQGRQLIRLSAFFFPLIRKTSFHHLEPFH